MAIKAAFWPLGGGQQVDLSPVRVDHAEDIQEYKVPAGVKKLQIDCVAAKGANCAGVGGNGGRVECILSVKAGQILYITAGKVPAVHNIAEYNASDIRLGGTELSDRVVVAGGGGSSNVNLSQGAKRGGHGGGLTGGNGEGGYASGGFGGTQTEGGRAGIHLSGTNHGFYSGAQGKFGLGGNGGNGNVGAGGAGWYGGGGGSSMNVSKVPGMSNTAGGGGSSYTDPELCSEVVHTQGFNADGNGYVIITPLKN